MDFTSARRKMVDCQIRPNDVTDKGVIDAFASVPREAFVPKAKQSVAYSEAEVETSEGRALWLARDLSKLLQALEMKSGELGLVIGAGEGYSAALISCVLDTVIALDESEDLVEEAGDVLTSQGYDSVAYVKGALKDGYPGEGPYDVILVNGSVEAISDAWIKQLKPGGRMGVVLADNDAGKVRVYTASEQSVSFRTEFECNPPHFAELDAESEFVF